MVVLDCIMYYIINLWYATGCSEYTHKHTSTKPTWFCSL